DAVSGVQAAKAAGMRCVAVAQTFPADQLTRADLVRSGVADLSVSDLLGRPDGPLASTQLTPPPVPLREENQPPSRRWGFWATIALTMVVLIAGLIAQLAVVVLWLSAHRLHPRRLSINGTLLALSACASA